MATTAAATPMPADAPGERDLWFDLEEGVELGIVVGVVMDWGSVGEGVDEVVEVIRVDDNENVTEVEEVDDVDKDVDVFEVGLEA